MDAKNLEEQSRISMEASSLLGKICDLFSGHGKVRATIQVDTDDFAVTISTEPLTFDPSEEVQIYRAIVTKDSVTQIPTSQDETIN